ncbi:hypothetical protein OPV22_015887 [Ensete ventricosum]|uniref:Uncharacterized protein n=1 Tax=Ensete ventricosum TaxID=4639 RepID=A0AAV8R985_ENSVE|nr:hypothetical protein OPV22_015887 [Ensete ventricosum]
MMLHHLVTMRRCIDYDSVVTVPCKCGEGKSKSESFTGRRSDIVKRIEVLLWVQQPYGGPRDCPYSYHRRACIAC